MAFGRGSIERFRLERDLYRGLSVAGHIELIGVEFIDFGRGAQVAFRVNGRPGRGAARQYRLTPGTGDVAVLGFAYGRRIAASIKKTRERKRIAKQRRRK